MKRREPRRAVLEIVHDTVRLAAAAAAVTVAICMSISVALDDAPWASVPIVVALLGFGASVLGRARNP
jgi:hypothetical protein